VLANLFLDHFDEEVAARGGRLVRYADDCAPRRRDGPGTGPDPERHAA